MSEIQRIIGVRFIPDQLFVRRESLDKPIAFAPSVFFCDTLSLWQLRCSLYDFFSNFVHNVEQKILRPMEQKKEQYFLLVYP